MVDVVIGSTGCVDSCGGASLVELLLLLLEPSEALASKRMAIRARVSVFAVVSSVWMGAAEVTRTHCRTLLHSRRHTARTANCRRPILFRGSFIYIYIYVQKRLMQLIRVVPPVFFLFVYVCGMGAECA